MAIKGIKKLLKKRQTIVLSEESKKRAAVTFRKNYREGKHAKFFRPSDIRYWLNKGYEYEEAKKQMFELYSKSSKKFHEKIRQSGKKFLTIRQLKYWTELGLTEEEAKEQLRRIQDKRSLKYFIRKYGEDEGTKKFNETTEKWLTTLNNKSEEEKLDILLRKTKRSKRYSNASIQLFDKVFQELKDIYGIEFTKIYYKEKEYYIYDYDNKRIYYYDLMIKDINLIIEFNGICFHPNKDSLSLKEWNAWINPITKQNADYHYEYDIRKKTLAEINGFNYLIIWENETFDNNKNKIINKILSLYENGNN